MAPFNSRFIVSLLSLIFLELILDSYVQGSSQAKITTKNSYIIHTDNLTRPSHFPTQTHWYSSIIKSAIIDNKTSITNHSDHYDRIFYTYDAVMHGFAATLTPQEAERVSEIPGVIGVYDDLIVQLHTTRSPDFLGLSQGYNIWPESTDVIVGLVDSGIWPESPAFNDRGSSPVPPQWRGECMSGEYFNSSMCNNKLIGARFFTAGSKARGYVFDDGSEFLSPRDKVGHGTHTASTAVGSDVANANLFGYANGTARGMATGARVAMYKACWGFGCMTTDIVAAIDAAIKDGVHILSISLGAVPQQFHRDAVAIAAFSAVRNGIFVAMSAGNAGPGELTVTNTAPWIMTVGAGSIDRKFPARVMLGNGAVYEGESIYAMGCNLSDMTPLVYLGECSDFDIVAKTVMGKIVVCKEQLGLGLVQTGAQIAAAGGVGLIGLNNPEQGEGIMVKAFTLPAITLGYFEGKKMVSYIYSSSNPMAMLKFSYQTVIGESRAPTVAYFSSRGPNSVLPEVLKPDILAPGMNIIASWPTETPVTGIETVSRRARFNIISGTSMSCPHVAGIAALLRAAHPHWSPAMIRSAMMTTAFALDNSYRQIILDENLKPASPLAIGAGHIHPVNARNPGLVYDAGIQDYINLLCTMNYTKKEMKKFMPGPFLCSKFKEGAGDFNYPSFVVLFDNKTSARMLKRTLTKVSELPESYEARVVNPRPDKVVVIVEPGKLEFGGMNEKLTYKVQFMSKVSSVKTDEMEYGYIIWENKEHQVKSPVVFMWKGN